MQAELEKTKVSIESFPAHAINRFIHILNLFRAGGGLFSYF